MSFVFFMPAHLDCAFHNYLIKGMIFKIIIDYWEVFLQNLRKSARFSYDNLEEDGCG